MSNKRKTRKDDRGEAPPPSGNQHQAVHDGVLSEPERETWGGRLDFIMSLISYAVGLGNVWRFPYLCYKNGGAVFLIPYLFFLTFCGVPMFFLECAFGQFASLSPITIWRISPFFKGVGVGMVTVTLLVCAYYNVINAWSLYFLINGLRPTLPWSTCDNSWNTPRCSTKCINSTTESKNLPLCNRTEVNAKIAAMPTSKNLNHDATDCRVRYVSPSEEYWENEVLDISNGIDEPNGIKWELLGCLFAVWVMVFFSLMKGVKSSGKIVYFTALFPYFCLIFLLIRALTLDGAIDGLKFYMIPNFDKLWTLQIWGEAAMQIFFSVGVAFGALITLSSFNDFNNNCYRDARLVPIINCSTSIFAGFVIFSILGFMAKETCTTVENVVTQGPGLVFVVYPQAIARFPLPQVWCFLFFSMLLSVGLGSQLSMFQTVTNAFMDEIVSLRRRRLPYLFFMILFMFGLGVPCVTRGGIYFLQVMDWYSSTVSLMILSFVELIVICWVYGVNRFYNDIQLMIGFRPHSYFMYMWCVFTPTLIIFVLGFSIATHTPVSYGDGDGIYTYPAWAIRLGWVLALSSIVPFPVVAIYKVITADGTVKEKFLSTLKPDILWGPALEENFARYIESLQLRQLNSGSTLSTLSSITFGERLSKQETEC